MPQILSDPESRKIAQNGYREMADAILSLLQNHPEGLRNVEVAKLLGLESKPHESQRNYFTWKILAHLVNDGHVEKSNAPHAKYRLIES